MRKLSIEIDGKIRQGLAQKVKGVLWVHYQGLTYTYQPQENYAQGGGANSLDPSQIKAPMPGKVIKINVRQGDVINGGDVIVIMEAMKMEYTLKAQSNGTIKNLGCAEGDQVTLGQILVKLEVENG